MIVLGIESSCDETAASIVKNNKILSNVVASQIDIHKIFGGVVPELAARHHIRNLPVVVKEAVEKSGISIKEINVIGVTVKPGLVGALLTGLSYAKGLSYSLNIPLIGINHLEAHFTAAFIENVVKYPFISLVVSGGHTSLFYVKEPMNYKIIGETRDDAAGEAFDKVSKLLGLGYPGGQIIDELSKKGNPLTYNFPRGMIKSKNYDFSFSGVKTSVSTFVKKNPEILNSNLNDLVSSFQEAVVDVLVEKLYNASVDYGVSNVVVAGGVAANSRLRYKMIEKFSDKRIKPVFPSLRYCTDNAAMVAYTTQNYFLANKIDDLSLDASDRYE